MSPWRNPSRGQAAESSLCPTCKAVSPGPFPRSLVLGEAQPKNLPAAAFPVLVTACLGAPVHGLQGGRKALRASAGVRAGCWQGAGLGARGSLVQPGGSWTGGFSPDGRASCWNAAPTRGAGSRSCRKRVPSPPQRAAVWLGKGRFSVLEMAGAGAYR